MQILFTFTFILFREKTFFLMRKLSSHDQSSFLFQKLKKKGWMQFSLRTECTMVTAFSWRKDFRTDEIQSLLAPCCLVMFLVTHQPWPAIISHSRGTYRLSWGADVSYWSLKQQENPKVIFPAIAAWWKSVFCLNTNDSLDWRIRTSANTLFSPHSLQSAKQHLNHRKVSQLQFKCIRLPCICRSFSTIIYTDFKYVTWFHT